MGCFGWLLVVAGLLDFLLVLLPVIVVCLVLILLLVCLFVGGNACLSLFG